MDAHLICKNNNRFHRQRTPTYSDEPLFSHIFRLLYRIVRVTTYVANKYIILYIYIAWSLGFCGMLSIIIGILWILLLCLSTVHCD